MSKRTEDFEAFYGVSQPDIDFKPSKLTFWVGNSESVEYIPVGYSVSGGGMVRFDKRLYVGIVVGVDYLPNGDIDVIFQERDFVITFKKDDEYLEKLPMYNDAESNANYGRLG